MDQRTNRRWAQKTTRGYRHLKMADDHTKRKLVSVPMPPEMFEALHAYCAERDVPVARWCRSLIERELTHFNAHKVDKLGE